MGKQQPKRKYMYHSFKYVDKAPNWSITLLSAKGSNYTNDVKAGYVLAKEKKKRKITDFFDKKVLEAWGNCNQKENVCITPSSR